MSQSKIYLYKEVTGLFDDCNLFCSFQYFIICIPHKIIIITFLNIYLISETRSLKFRILFSNLKKKTKIAIF